LIRPTPEQLALLRPTERFWFATVDFCLRYLTGPLILWNRLNMMNVAKLMNGRRWQIHGREHIDEFTKTDRLIIASNHRSFFDFYVVGTILYIHTPLPKRFLFPVRSSFFYDSIFGGLVNGWMSGFLMFPPILREAPRRAFNQYSLDRISAELKGGGQVIGMHPEGKRGKGPTPYTLLKAQPGIGAILLSSPKTRVLPVFITGLSNSMKTEFSRTWASRDSFPIDVVFGAPLEFDDLREAGDKPRNHLAATQRTMAAIQALGQFHRVHIAGEE
jgi:1-acyl-sn-glycerol-3-phosphate acyltransferase